MFEAGNGPVVLVQANVISAGQVMTGAVVSVTVIVWVQVPALLQLSVAVHVRVMTDALAQVPAATLSLAETAGAPSQLSVAAALPVLTGAVEASHVTVTLAGQVMTGAVASTTRIVWPQLLLLPQASFAVQVRVMTDASAQLPAATLSVAEIAGAPSQLSVAVAVPVLAAAEEALHSTVTSAGQEMTGAVESVTVIV